MGHGHGKFTCNLDHKLFLLVQEEVVNGAGHIVVAPLVDHHRSFQTEQALGIFDNGFSFRRQALSLMVPPVSLGLGIPTTGAALQLNASFFKALKRDMRI